MPMSVTLTIAELTERFPDFRVAAVLVRSLAVAKERPPALAAVIAEREARCRMRHGETVLSEIPGVAAWRTAYRGFGIKKTSYRSSVERLIKRVLGGESLPAVNSFVDLYNAVSLEHGLCVGADDRRLTVPPIAFRFARSGDSFVDMGVEGDAADDPPKLGEVVLADDRHVLCRRWNWRQDRRSMNTEDTTEAIVTLQAHGWGDVEAAAVDLASLAGRFCGARCVSAIADRSNPVVNLS
jgi:DNA/RNA-binding domain of Phe-tRNA-synthetase-like protein